MKLITVQSKKVLNTLLDGKVFIAGKNQGYLADSYAVMQEYYDYDFTPIFCGKVGSLCEFYGITTTDAYILQLDVPDKFCNFQSYYDWCDVIYYMEDPEEWHHPDVTLDEYIDQVLAGDYIDPRSPIQVTIPYILPEWLDDYISYTGKFDRMHNGSGGNNKLHTLRYYG